MNKDWQSQLPIDDIKELIPVSGGDVMKHIELKDRVERIFYLFNIIETKILRCRNCWFRSI